jgi:hypothetical protein
METDLTQLKIKKLLSEYSFLLIDEEYKDEVVRKYSPEFLKLVNTELSKDPIPDDSTIQKKKEPLTIDSESSEKLKKMYREIVKLTHPDKVGNSMLEFYLRAKSAYELNNFVDLLMVAHSLNITVELSDLDINAIRLAIEEKKKKLESLESSFLWLWAHELDLEKQKFIVAQFIEFRRSLRGSS